MSGIAGFFDLSRSGINHSVDHKIGDSIRRRGIDGINSISSDNFVLFHSSLNVTKENLTEDLPFFHKQYQIYIVCDARIDNINELTEDLNLKSAQTDSSIIIEAYRKWGTECSQKLIGAFSFIIYDTKLNLIFASRDHIGMKPFYYHFSGDRLIFSSEIKTILQSKYYSKSLNRERVIDFLMFFSPKEGETFFKDVHKLPRSHSLLIRNRQLELHKYFEFDESKLTVYKNIEDYSDHFYELFSSIVSGLNERTLGDVGITLSGGLDSSSINCLSMKNDNNKINIHSRSVLFEGLNKHEYEKVNELSYMQDCLELYPNVNHKYLFLKDTGPISNLKYMTEVFDEPASTINAFVYKDILTSLKEENIRVMMDGLDGDTVVSHGHEILPQLALGFKFKELFNLAEENNKKFGLGRPSKYKLIKKNLILNLIPKYLYWIYRNKGEDKLIQYKMYKALNFKERERFDPYLRYKKHYENFPIRPSGHARKDHKLSMSGVHWETAIENLEPLSAINNIEHRMPFFDRRLMEYCLSIPSDLKFKDGISRYTFRESMKGILPNSIYSRVSKSDLSPFSIREINDLSKEDLDSFFFSQNSPVRSLIDSQVIREMIEDLHNPKNDQSLIAYNLFRFISLSKWMQKEEFSW